MLEAERELYKLGVPVKTRHNEVAPASTRSRRSIEIGQPRHRPPAARDDHAASASPQKYGMACLLHEKPFAGINGSRQAPQLVARQLDARATCSIRATRPHENAQFLVFCARRHPRRAQATPTLLRAVVASAGNDHRLGANEAPPAIISIFLGDLLTDVFEQIKARRREDLEAERHADDRRRYAAAAAEGCRRPQPHQPVCLHRQQVRVPRRRLQPVDRRSARRAEHHRRRVARLHGHRAGKGHRRRPAKLNAAVQTLLKDDHRRARRRDLQRQRLLRRVARRKPKSAACRTSKPSIDALPVDRRQERRRRCSRSTASSRTASWRAARTSTSSSTARRSTSRAKLTVEDGPHDDLPGGDPLPGRSSPRPPRTSRPPGYKFDTGMLEKVISAGGATCTTAVDELEEVEGNATAAASARRRQTLLRRGAAGAC